MGLLVGGAELGAESYRRIPVDPLRTLDAGFYEIEGLFRPDEVWEGITALALWSEAEGGQCFYVKVCEEPVSVEPGFTIRLTMRIKDDARTAGWRSLVQTFLPGDELAVEAP